MRNFLQDILQTAINDCQGEKITSIVIGGFGSWSFSDDERSVPDAIKGKPISWSEAAKYLDYEYDDGYGGADCHAIYAYTENYVIYVSEYDGSTSVEAMPRNPVQCTPRMT